MCSLAPLALALKIYTRTHQDVEPPALMATWLEGAVLPAESPTAMVTDWPAARSTVQVTPVSLVWGKERSVVPMSPGAVIRGK